jgi:predicted AlkP superfamily pyrophosphatase or phosphodiesterase
MKKKSLLLTAISICVFSSSFFNGCNNGKEKGKNSRYNIVLIVSDALRFDVPGCYGGAAKTPNIDRLAGNGALFENAYSTAPCVGAHRSPFGPSRRFAPPRYSLLTKV